MNLVGNAIKFTKQARLYRYAVDSLGLDTTVCTSNLLPLFESELQESLGNYDRVREGAEIVRSPAQDALDRRLGLLG